MDNQTPQVSQKRTIKDFFAYTKTFSSLTSGSTSTGNVNIQADSDFVIQKLAYTADIAAAAQTDSSRVIPLATILIVDSGSGRQLMDSAIPINSLFGNGSLPFILPQPKLLLSRSSVSITLVNYSAATDYNIYISLIGYKVFRLG